MKHRLIAAVGLLCCAAAVQARDIKIAHVYTRTGPLEGYGMETLLAPIAEEYKKS